MVREGVSVEDVRAIALGVFHQNFLELRGVAEDVARGRAEKITNDFLVALEDRAPSGLNAASDPDMQRAIFDAQKEYACSGDEDLETVLVDLLVGRASETTRETRTIVLNEAIKAAPKLTPQQRRAIGVCFLCRYASWHGPPLVDAYFETFVRGNLLKLAADGLPTKDSAYQHIEYVGAGAVSIGSIGLATALGQSARPYFTHGFSRDQVAEPLTNLLENPAFLMPAIRDPDKFQLAVVLRRDLEHLVSSLADESLGPQVTSLFDLGGMDDKEVKDDVLQRVPETAPVFEAWDGTALKSLTLTSVGIAIGHGYWRRVTNGDAPLSIWISD